MDAAGIRPRSRAPALLLAPMALLIAACAAPAATTPATATGSPNPTPSPAVGPLVSPTAMAAATATPLPAVTLPPVVTTPPATVAPATPPPPSMAPGIGVAIQIGDQQFMTVLAFERWTGTTTVKPRKGKAFVTVSVRIDAIKVTSFDSADFKLRDAADRAYSWRQGRAPHLYSLNGMNPGSTYTGWVTYEVPKSSLGEFVLVYKPSFLPGSTYRIPLS